MLVQPPGAHLNPYLFQLGIAPKMKAVSWLVATVTIPNRTIHALDYISTTYSMFGRIEGLQRLHHLTLV